MTTAKRKMFMLGEIWGNFASNRKQKMLIIVKRWLVGMGLQYLSLVSV